jgi:transcriptional regulator of arginine metabolism
MKPTRQAAILRLVRERRIGNQEALRQALAAEGIEVTQATLSRDLHELGVVKQAEGDGASHYHVPSEPTPRPDLARLLPALLTGVDGTGPLLVLRTVRGGGGAVAAALGDMAHEEVLAAIPSDDVVLVVARTPKAREALGERLAGLVRT